jgi:hypothetical protein
MIESEFIALNKAKEEAKWLWNFSKDILYWPKPMPAICVHCDNQSAIERVQSSMYNGRSRHIHHRYNTIKNLLSNIIIYFNYVKSNKNIMDPLTKGLLKKLVYNSSRVMDLKPLKDEIV